MKEKIAIIGGKSREENFHHGKNVEVWCLNMIMPSWLPYCTRLFNIHKFDSLVRYGYQIHKDVEWAYEHQDVPFITVDKWPKSNVYPLKNNIIFPSVKMAKAMPRWNYHCGSFDWLVAYAVYIGVSEINLHGIGLCLEAGEPISSRACLEYWCGYAEGRGIKVTAAEDCDIFHFYHLVKSKMIYGYDDTPVYEDRTKKGVAYKL